MTAFGYARVSTDGQTLDAQVAELSAAGAAKVYREKVSGALSSRVQLSRALAALGEGDVLLVTRLDRLARSTRDLLNTLAAIAEKGAGFRSLRDTWADTTTPHGRLMLTVLAGLAEFERELIRARTGEGRKRAKARGVRFWPFAQAQQASTAGSAPAARRWRNAGRYSATRQRSGDCSRMSAALSDWAAQAWPRDETKRGHAREG